METIQKYCGRKLLPPKTESVNGTFTLEVSVVGDDDADRVIMKDGTLQACLDKAAVTILSCDEYFMLYGPNGSYSGNNADELYTRVSAQ